MNKINFGRLLRCLAVIFGMGAAGLGWRVQASPIEGQGLPSDVLTSGTVIDFESTTLGSYTTLTTSGVTFSGSGNDGTFVVSTDYAGDYNTRGAQSVNNNQGNGVTTFNFNFNGTVSAFAFLFGASDDIWVLTARNSGGNVIETLSLTPTNSSNAGDYFGLQDPGIATATLTDATGTDDFIFIDDFTFVSAPSSFAGLAGANYTPNQLAVATYLDANSSSANTAFQNLLTNLHLLTANAAAFGAYLDQLSPVNFARFSSSQAFNNSSFLTQQMDNYFDNHRGADGSFLSSNGGIDYSGLTVNDPDYLPGLQMVHSRLLAWDPAPSTGVISDVASPVLGGIDMPSTGGGAATTNPNRWNAFVSGNAILAQDFSDPSVGESHVDQTTGAVQLGADYRLTANFLLGVMFGYGHTDADLDNLGSRASVDTYSPSVYASYSQGGWYANAIGSYGFSNYSQDRNVSLGAFSGTAHSSPSGDQITGDLDGGYDLHSGGWTFGPTAGVQYVHLDVDGYTETGLPGADLSVADSQADSLRSRLGGHASLTFQGCGLTFVPHVSASWQHEFLDQSRGLTSQFDGVGGGSFTVQTANPSRDSVLADIGLDAQIDRTWTVFADYSVQAGQDNYFGQSVQGGVKIGF